MLFKTAPKTLLQKATKIERFTRKKAGKRAEKKWVQRLEAPVEKKGNLV